MRAERRLRALIATASVLLAACRDDPGPSSAPDALDTAPETASDAGPDASPDAGPDVPSDAAPNLSKEPPQGLCEPNLEPFPVRPAASPATLPPLHVADTDIVDDAGQRVALRGVNLGSWLDIEPWIIGVTVLESGITETIDLLNAQAEELGCAETLTVALEEGLAAYLFDGATYPEIIEIVRQASYAQLVPGEEAGVDAFWAWFDAIPFVHSEQDLWWAVGDRFGWDEAMALRQRFRQTYVTAQDFANVRALGLNVVRLPFWWDWLESDDLGAAAFRPDGWALLHEIMEWARDAQLYVVVDMHGAPGGQSREPHCGTSYGNKLWDHEACIAKTARLWQALASFLAGDPHVAAYDLLNEPMTAPAKEVHEAVLDRIYDAIREVDADHIVMYEDGYLAKKALPSPVEMGWENYVFSVHIYTGGDTPESAVAKHRESLLGFQAYWSEHARCPILVGEFAIAEDRPESAAGMDAVFALFNQMGIHWTPWTYKYWKEESYWGLYHPAVPVASFDPTTAGRAELEAIFDAMHSDHFTPHEDLLHAYEARAIEPPQPLSLE